MIFGILILVRTLQKINIYRNNLTVGPIELEILWRENTTSCWQSQSHILIYLPDCFKYPAGSYLRVIGSLQESSDSNENGPKTLMVQSIQPVIYSRVSVKYLFSSWWQIMANLRRNLLDQIRWMLGYSGGSLLFSLVLGGVRSTPEVVQQGIENLGLMYIFSASGMHVGLLLKMVSKRIKKLSSRAQLVIQVFVLIIYSSLTLWRPAIIRSGLMAGYRLLAKHVWRRPASTLLSLAWTVILMLWLNPLWWLESAFWMSVTATLAILLVSHITGQTNRFFVWEMGGNDQFGASSTLLNNDWLREKGRSKIIKYTRETILFSLTAQLAILPLVIQSFGKWSWIGFVSSWLVLWCLPGVFRIGVTLVAGLLVVNLPQLLSSHLMLTRGAGWDVVKLLTLPIRGWLAGFSQVLAKTSHITWTLLSFNTWSVRVIWTWYIGWCTALFAWKQINNHGKKMQIGGW